MGLSLPLHHARIKAARQGVKMANVEVGSQQKERGTSHWGMVVGVGSRAKEWGVEEDNVGLG